VVTVRVDNNEVDKAFRKLKRNMLSEGITRKLRSIQVYLKPSEERVRGRPCGGAFCSTLCTDASPRRQVLEGKATEKRLRKRAMKHRLNWILRKKERGF
jgi:ribosomal protein S21